VQTGELLGGEQVHEVPPYRLDMVRRDLAHRLAAQVGQDREQSAAVRLAVLAPDQAGVLHAGDLVREPALGLQGGGGEIAHPHALVVRLREVDQDLVVVHGQPERLEVLLQLMRQQPADVQVGAPGALLRVGQPAGGRLGLHVWILPKMLKAGRSRGV
jgi:hypothetical protein